MEVFEATLLSRKSLNSCGRITGDGLPDLLLSSPRTSSANLPMIPSDFLEVPEAGDSFLVGGLYPGGLNRADRGF